MSKLNRPLGAVDLELERVLRPEAARGLDRADRAVLEVHDRLDRSSTVTARRPRGPWRRCACDASPDAISPTRYRARSITCAPRSPSAPEPATSLSEPPDHREVRVDDPLLQVAPAEVEDLAELAGLDDHAREPDGRHEAVVEGAPSPSRRSRRRASTSRRTRPRCGRAGFSQITCLPRLGGRDRRLGVEVVRPGVVERADPVVGDDLLPVRDVAVEPVPAGGARHGLRCDPRSTPAAASAAAATVM